MNSLTSASDALRTYWVVAKGLFSTPADLQVHKRMNKKQVAPSAIGQKEFWVCTGFH